MVLKKYGALFIFSMSLLTTTPLFAPAGNGIDDVSTLSTTPLKKITDQPSKEEQLTPEECNRRYLYAEPEGLPEPTVVDIVLAKASQTLTPVLEVLSDPKAVGQSIVDAVIKNSPKAVQMLRDAKATVATSAKSAASTILQLPPVVHIQNVYAMYTLGEEVGNGIALVLPKEEDDFTIVIDTNKPDASPASSST